MINGNRVQYPRFSKVWTGLSFIHLSIPSVYVVSPQNESTLEPSLLGHVFRAVFPVWGAGMHSHFVFLEDPSLDL